MSKEMEALIEETAKAENISKAEVIRKAFALLQISESEKKKGNSIGIISEDTSNHEMKVVGRIVGL
ncbi:hypothetical protein VBP92_27120 [Klebsiella variicola]|uniref:hypothetical protein n=1 Tax=Klebsiella variicola TaxID=244366 RepID=UPI002B1ED14E|nr:hypothetical protein [Klebsiella variicola]MEA5495555.1 hypothetical protein [Klebsiella variicola]